MPLIPASLYRGRRDPRRYLPEKRLPMPVGELSGRFDVGFSLTSNSIALRARGSSSTIMQFIVELLGDIISFGCSGLFSKYALTVDQFEAPTDIP